MLGASRWASRPGRGTAAPQRACVATPLPCRAAPRHATPWLGASGCRGKADLLLERGEREKRRRGGANQQALRSGQAQGPTHRGKPSRYNDGVLLGGQRALNEPTKRLPDSEPLNKVSRRTALESIDGLPSARVCGHTPSRGCSKG